ncbi:hypothetical protein GF336_03430 [Candidatus Woesearchaeota archaeon]|nr:hypothetical protein [Candidatus Woesearchaeota archaeon]
MDTEILERLGLTRNEIAVYISLLELGTSTAGPITKKSELHSSRVYESLNKLAEKGLVSFVIKNNRKYFSASDPDNLLDIVDEERRAIEEILPELNILKKQKKEEESSTIYEGYKGVRNVYDSIIRILKKGDEILVFGASGQDESFMSNTYFKEYTQRRIKKGIKMRIIFNADAKDTGNFYSRLKNTKVRYMPPNMKTPAAVDIFSNNIGILVLKPLPKIFLITSKEVASSYRSFFEMLWEISG